MVKCNQLHAADRTHRRALISLRAGLNLVCCQTAKVASYEDIVGLPPDEGVKVYKYIPGPGRLSFDPLGADATNFMVFTFANGGWSPSPPVVDITEAVWVYEPAPPLFNAQLTSQGIAFDLKPTQGTQVTVEYADSLSTQSWQVLTNVVGNGDPMKVVDNSIATTVTQRFYRTRTSQ